MSTTESLSNTILEELAKYDTPTICNVIELWNIRPHNTGFMNHTIKACFPKMKPMVGYALTSTFRSMAPPRSGDVYSGLDAQVAAFDSLPGAPIVVYQDIDEPTVSATFGEVMCTTYKAYGAKGIITSGAGRDLDQVEALGFPAFTNGAVCAHGYCHTLQINVPVTVGGISIYPGDLLHGDLNGVTTIPHEIASEVADACEDLVKAENIVLNYLKESYLTFEGLKAAYKELKVEVTKLGKRLRCE